jgi:adenosylcobinamide-phosphate synthase
MWGHRNERYRDFGALAARLDDLAGFLPARLCGLTMILAAGLCAQDMGRAWRVLRRDRLRHASPNSAHAEAPAAGALGIRLGGPVRYQGQLRHAPWLGLEGREAASKDIHRVCRLVLVTGLLWSAAMAAVLALAGASGR